MLLDTQDVGSFFSFYARRTPFTSPPALTTPSTSPPCQPLLSSHPSRPLPSRLSSSVSPTATRPLFAPSSRPIPVKTPAHRTPPPPLERGRRRRCRPSCHEPGRLATSTAAGLATSCKRWSQVRRPRGCCRSLAPPCRTSPREHTGCKRRGWRLGSRTKTNLLCFFYLAPRYFLRFLESILELELS